MTEKSTDTCVKPYYEPTFSHFLKYPFPKRKSQRGRKIKDFVSFLDVSENAGP